MISKKGDKNKITKCFFTNELQNLLLQRNDKMFFYK